MLNIVIPMAGAGSRFADAGYLDPKPLIEVKGIPMIQLVIRNLKPNVEHRFIFVVQKRHYHEYKLEQLIGEVTNDSKFVLVDGITQGAACTVLEAIDYIDNEDPLMIANSDQYLDFEIDDYLDQVPNSSEGLIMTMHASGDKWSYLNVDENGYVSEVAEKREISNIATTGVYNFAKGSTFVLGANAMIANDERVNGEFYVAPVYNYLISRGYRIRHHLIGDCGKAMYGLGTPEDLGYFLKHFGVEG